MGTQPTHQRVRLAGFGRGAGLLLALMLAVASGSAGTAAGLAGDGEGAEVGGYDFHSTAALANGLTVRFVVQKFFVVEDIVDLSSVTSEARVAVDRSTSLAVLPNPGDLVLAVPGLLASLGGVSGLPAYPTAARADHPTAPEQRVEFGAPGTGGVVAAKAKAEQAEADAALVRFTSPPEAALPLTAASVTSWGRARRIGPAGFEAEATSLTEGLNVLDGLLEIDSVRSTTKVSWEAGRPSHTAASTVIGARVAGVPVTITERGVESPAGTTGPDQIEGLRKVLGERGVDVSVTGATAATSSNGVRAASGALVVSIRTEIQSYPATVSLTLGGAEGGIRVDGPLTAATPVPIPGVSAPEPVSAPGVPDPDGEQSEHRTASTVAQRAVPSPPRGRMAVPFTDPPAAPLPVAAPEQAHASVEPPEAARHRPVTMVAAVSTDLRRFYAWLAAAIAASLCAPAMLRRFGADLGRRQMSDLRSIRRW